MRTEPTVSFAPTYSQVDIELVMHDSHGDGWNGAAATVTNEAGDVVLTATLDGGSGDVAVFTGFDEACYVVEVSSANLDLGTHRNCEFVNRRQNSTNGSVLLSGIRIGDYLVLDYTLEAWGSNLTSLNATLAIADPYTAGGDENAGILNPDDMAGSVALIGLSDTDWKGLTDPDIKAKALAAQEAGAIAVIFANDNRDDPDEVYIICPAVRLAEHAECPAGSYNIARCNTGIPVGEQCEGDGECETDGGANTCGSWDIYVVLESAKLVDIPVMMVSYNAGVQALSRGAGASVVVSEGVDREISWSLSASTDAAVVTGGAPSKTRVQVRSGVMYDHCDQPSPHPTAPTPEPTVSIAPTSSAMIEFSMQGRSSPAGWNGAVATFTDLTFGNGTVVEVHGCSGAKACWETLKLTEGRCYRMDMTGGTYPSEVSWGLACDPVCAITCTESVDCAPRTVEFYIHMGEVLEGCAPPTPTPTTATPTMTPYPTPVPTPKPTPSPTATFAPTPFEAFEVLSGPCTSTSKCVYSSNFPDNYGDDEDCEILAKKDGVLNVANFAVESHGVCGYDYFQVSGTKYCDTNGPQDVPISRDMILKFHSDGGTSGPTPSRAFPPSPRYLT